MGIRRLLTFGLIIPFLTSAASNGLATDTGLLFVSSERSDSLVILDPRTSRIVKYLKTSRRPSDLHFNTDHTYLYVACGDEDAIDVIDVAKLEVVGRLHTASNPRAFGINEKQRRIYVPNAEGSSLSVIDMDQNVIIQEVPTGRGAEEVFVSEDGHFAYVLPRPAISLILSMRTRASWCRTSRWGRGRDGLQRGPTARSCRCRANYPARSILSTARSSRLRATSNFCRPACKRSTRRPLIL